MLVFVFRVGIEIPTIEVRYEHLIIEAEAYVGGRALPTFMNSITNTLEVSKSMKILFSHLLFLCFAISLTTVHSFGLLEYLHLSPYSQKQKETYDYP